MLRSVRKISTSSRIVRHAAAGSIVGLALSLAGCSADIGRFGGAGLGFNGESQGGPTASLPTPTAPMQRAETPVSEPRQAYVPPMPPRATEPAVKVAGLPEPAPARDYSAPPASSQPRMVPSTRAASPSPAQGAGPAATIPAKPGETIEVQAGDTLYGISKRYRVSISELMTLNNLQSPALKPGQKLTLPAGKRAVATRGSGASQPTTALNPASAPPIASSTPTRGTSGPAASAAAPVDWTGTYTMAPGDSLYAVARRHKVKTAELQSANGITDPTKIRPGTVIKVPAAEGTAAVPPSRLPAAAPAPAVAAPSAPAAAGPRPTIINADTPVAERKVAALSPAAGGTQSDAAPEPPAAVAPAETPKSAGSGRFRWPVKGKVISGFGARSDGTHNDGVNISVPAGTDVHAAENGVVAYAGNELKGYGNLVLIRHENNWVSAYAHNDQILVKRGDKVKRGQPIAKAGNTGSVDHPQVHFELRQGSKPVDPMPHLEAN